jgi:uncharacterized peroxidase-related enzyme
MTEFTIHTLDSAPEGGRERLQQSKDSFGMIPNLHAVMAESPQTLEAYQELTRLFSETSLTAVERNVVWLTINVRHDCHYCVPAHTAIAKSQGVPDAVINALREARALEDAKLEALRVFTLAVVDKRGAVDQADFDAFFNAGYAQRQALDVVTGVAHKVLSNYVNHFAETPVDEAFQKFAWTPQAQAAE